MYSILGHEHRRPILNPTSSYIHQGRIQGVDWVASHPLLEHPRKNKNK